MWVPVISSYLWDKIINRELLLKHYCKDTSLYMGEDAVCAYECVYCADQIYFSSRIMYYYDFSSESSMHRKYHKDLLDNFQRVVKYYRAHLGGHGDEAIERQINRIEYDGLYYSVWQELQFSSSLHKSSVHLKRQMRQMKNWPVCSMNGLSFAEKGVVLLMSFRALYVILIIMKFLYGMLRFWRKMMLIVKRSKQTLKGG